MADMDVIIVNFNTRDHLAACLNTIPRESCPEVIVVDNASSDGSVEMLGADYPWVTVLANHANLGYGAAANLGIRHSAADYALLLNSDTRLEPDSLRNLGCYLDNHPTVAIVGPRLANCDGTLQPSCYHWPTPAGFLLDESGIGPSLRRIPIVRDAYLRTWQHDKARAVPWVLGAALAIRKRAFEDVDGFDESYYMYFEEADLCRRLSARGWQIHFAPVTTVTHEGGASTSQLRADMLTQVYASLRHYYCCHLPERQLTELDLAIKSVMVGRRVRDSIRVRMASPSTDKSRLREDLRGWRRVLASEGRLNTPTSKYLETRNDADKASRVQIRRADWRFLLPPPPCGAFEHLILLGGPSGLADRLVELGVARRVSTENSHDASSDAVAILGGCAGLDVLRSAIRSLRPNGVLYCEIDRRRSPRGFFVRPSSIRRLLRQYGFEINGTFWVAPSLNAPRKYIPLESLGASRWYLNTLCIGGTPFLRLVIAMANALGALPMKLFASNVPWFAITAVASPTERRQPGYLEPGQSLASSGSTNIRSLLITSGHDDGSRVVVLPFVDEREQPERVIKIARVPEMSTNIEGEQRVLIGLRDRLDPSISESIPQPLGLFRLGELAVGHESFADGQSMFVLTGQWGLTNRYKIENLRLASRWLTQFNRQFQFGDPAAGADEFAQAAATLFDRYVRAFNATQYERRLFAEVLSRSRQMAGSRLPTVWTHNDFGPWNVFRNRDGLRVIDWEVGWGPGFESVGPALCDLLYFITHWSFVAHGYHTESRWLRGFHQLFIGRDDGDELVSAACCVLEDYLREIEIDAQFVPLVLVYMWAERAVKRLDRRSLLGDVTSDARADDRFVTYVSHLASHQNQLFRLGESFSSPESQNGLRDMERIRARDDLLTMSPEGKLRS